MAGTCNQGRRWTERQGGLALQGVHVAGGCIELWRACMQRGLACAHAVREQQDLRKVWAV